MDASWDTAHPLKFAAFQTAPASAGLEKDFLTMAATLAARSGHPGGADLRSVAHRNGCAQAGVIGFKDFPGRGFGGAVQLPGEASPRAVLLGDRLFLSEAGLDIPALIEVAARRWEGEGAVILLGGWDGCVRGVLKFMTDGPRTP